MAQRLKASSTAEVNREREEQFCRAFEQLSSLMDWDQIERELPTRDNAVFTNSVVLLILLDQRMCPDKSLEATVKKLLEIAPSALSQNKLDSRSVASASNAC